MIIVPLKSLNLMVVYSTRFFSFFLNNIIFLGCLASALAQHFIQSWWWLASWCLPLEVFWTNSGSWSLVDLFLGMYNQQFYLQFHTLNILFSKQNWWRISGSSAKQLRCAVVQRQGAEFCVRAAAEFCPGRFHCQLQRDGTPVQLHQPVLPRPHLSWSCPIYW